MEFPFVACMAFLLLYAVLIGVPAVYVFFAYLVSKNNVGDNSSTKVSWNPPVHPLKGEVYEARSGEQYVYDGTVWILLL